MIILPPENESLVYAVSIAGHRQSWLDLLGPMFGLTAVVGKPEVAIFRRLIRAEKVLFSGLDDGMFTFAACAFLRSILQRRTVAFFLRPQTCFKTDKWFYPWKRRAFRLLRRLPGLTLITITPFEDHPQFAEVANVGVCDPQYWDMHDGTELRQPCTSPLSIDIMHDAQGRIVICGLGSIGQGKGFQFLADTLHAYPALIDKVLVVCAGCVTDDALARRLESGGAVVVNRFISNEELESLYGVADAIWACYAPSYDQASGIFGRALQLGVVPIVRKDSTIAEFATNRRLPCIAVKFDDSEDLVLALSDIAANPLESTDRSALVQEWRSHFTNELFNALQG